MPVKISCFICNTEIYSGTEPKSLEEAIKNYGSDKCKNCGHPFSVSPKQIWLVSPNGEPIELSSNPNQPNPKTKWWKEKEKKEK